jgi:hypothetical protein
MDERFNRRHSVSEDPAIWKAWLKKTSLKHLTGFLAITTALSQAQLSDLDVLRPLLDAGSPNKALEKRLRAAQRARLAADSNCLLAGYHDPANAMENQHLLCMVELIRMA